MPVKSTFLKIQNLDQPLFPDSLLSPERRDLRGKILLIGGSSAGFAGISYTYNQSLALGGGVIKVLLPKCLEKLLPKNPDFVFSGNPKALGFTREVESDLDNLTAWADAICLVGDFGKNSETQQIFSSFLENNTHKKPILVTRDAIDLLLPSLPLENPNLRLFLTFPQLQKLFKHLLYPKVITFTMPLPQLAETLHKFTLTYPCGIATFASDNYIVGINGDVIATNSTSTKYNPLTLWAGEAAIRTLLLTLWTPSPRIAGLAGGVL